MTCLKKVVLCAAAAMKSSHGVLPGPWNACHILLTSFCVKGTHHLLPTGDDNVSWACSIVVPVEVDAAFPIRVSDGDSLRCLVAFFFHVDNVPLSTQSGNLANCAHVRLLLLSTPASTSDVFGSIYLSFSCRSCTAFYTNLISCKMCSRTALTAVYCCFNVSVLDEWRYYLDRQ